MGAKLIRTWTRVTKQPFMRVQEWVWLDGHETMLTDSRVFIIIISRLKSVKNYLLLLSTSVFHQVSSLLLAKGAPITAVLSIRLE